MDIYSQEAFENEEQITKKWAKYAMLLIFFPFSEQALGLLTLVQIIKVLLQLIYDIKKVIKKEHQHFQD